MPRAFSITIVSAPGDRKEFSMMLRRLFIVLLCLLLLPLHATSEALLSADDAHIIVNGLFSSAAGVTFEAEASHRKVASYQDIDQRESQLAAYRASVLPWLLAVLQPDTEPSADFSSAWQALQENEMGNTYLEHLASLGVHAMEEQLALSRTAFQQWLKEVDHAKLLQINGDYSCWIYLHDSPIDYPVVQCGNNDTYLNRLFDGSRNKSGTLFIDYRNLPDFQDPNTLIYGHHMRNGTMFGSLVSFEQDGYFASHPYLLLFSESGMALVELFAGYVTSSDDPCYDIAISDEEDLYAFTDTALQRSSFHTPIDILPSDRLVTLSTCAYAFENARYLLIGRISCSWSYEETPALP